MATGSVPVRSTRRCTRWRLRDCCLRAREVIEGRSRRSYSITKSGRRVLNETTVQLRELANEVLGEGNW